MKFLLLSSFLATAALANNNKLINESCQIKYNAAADKFQGVAGENCDTGLVCNYEQDPGTNETIFDGVCELEACGGPADPERTQATSSIRVTICHRTCSETNPWVRITIDDDAWNGTDASGCGHLREHDVEEDCNLDVKDINVWGVGWDSYNDYLIKWHGTRGEVRLEHGWSSNGRSADEKAYWKYWERACPYVRNGACCTQNETYNDCCGDNPYDMEPQVALSKTVKEGESECPHEMSDEITITSGSTVTFCYLVTNTGEDRLCDISIDDANGCTSAVDTCLNPGESAYGTPCTQESVTEPQDCPIAMVTAEGWVTEETVTATDPACVYIPESDPPPEPEPDCAIEMGETESTYCEGEGVKLIEAKGAAPPGNVIFAITEGDTGGTPTIKFKVDNPLTTNADIYVQFHEKEGDAGAFDGICVGQMDAPGCNAAATEIEAACITPTGTSLSFTIVSIFFVSDDSYISAGGGEVEECCDESDATFPPPTPVVEYTYEIHCACPTNNRNLRGLPF